MEQTDKRRKPVPVREVIGARLVSSRRRNEMDDPLLSCQELALASTIGLGKEASQQAKLDDNSNLIASFGVKAVQEKAQAANQKASSTLAKEMLPSKQLDEAANPLEEEFSQ
ncbi:hypothetical protein CSUI_003228 [Cystoisospora suis]|uniref:Uncharacterized protein n=1 Tax=Cystoisospora suis TaxID=483139 RepID=A0A2C6L5T6_9APIC|nr:hypothetical protein CSUI_003228 [Cystoisospora suis]